VSSYGGRVGDTRWIRTAHPMRRTMQMWQILNSHDIEHTLEERMILIAVRKLYQCDEYKTRTEFAIYADLVREAELA